MADEEYAIYPLADCPWPSGVNLTAVTYDRSLELESDVVGITVGVLFTADKAIAPESKPMLELSVTPTRDVAVSPRSDFQSMYLNPTVTKDMWFALAAEPEPMKLSPTLRATARRGDFRPPLHEFRGCGDPPRRGFLGGGGDDGVAGGDFGDAPRNLFDRVRRPYL